MKILKMLLKVLTVLLGAAWAIGGFILDVFFGATELDENDHVNPVYSHDPKHMRTPGNSYWD